MAIKIRESVVHVESGNARVFHWDKHNPQLLVEAVENIPQRSLGKSPRVNLYKFGNQLIAVRQFGHFGGVNLFHALQQTAWKRAAVVELPVALIQHPEYGDLIVTLWKKDTIPLKELLEDDNAAVKRKKQACLSAVRKVAKLHAAGFEHGHLVNPLSGRLGNNVVVDKKGNAHLVDYTLLGELTGPRTGQYEIESFTDQLAWAVHGHNDKKRNRFESKLRQEYRKWRGGKQRVTS